MSDAPRLLAEAVELLRSFGRDDDGDGMVDAEAMDRVEAFLERLDRNDLEAAVQTAEASFAPDADDGAIGLDEATSLVSGGLDLLDDIGWTVLIQPGLVRFLIIPESGDTGTIWRATIEKESI